MQLKSISEKLKNKIAIKKLIPIVGGGIYVIGAFINSISNGISNTFKHTELPLLELNPIKNLIALFTPTGIGIIIFFIIMYCLFTKKRLFSDFGLQDGIRQGTKD